MIPSYEMSRMGKSIVSVSRLMVTYDWGVWENGQQLLIHEEFLFGMIKCSKIDCMHGCTNL